MLPLFPIVLEPVSLGDMVVYSPHFINHCCPTLRRKHCCSHFTLTNQNNKEIKKLANRAEEKAQWLRSLGALAENVASIPIIHMVAHSCSRGPNTLFWPLRIQSMHMVHRCASMQHPCTILKTDKSFKQKKLGHYDSTVNKQGVGFKTTSS